jgi:hypothetical protein
MGWLNGKDSAQERVLTTPVPVVEPEKALVTPDRINSSNPFTKAVKYNAKGRVALIGPAGGGEEFHRAGAGACPRRTERQDCGN